MDVLAALYSVTAAVLVVGAVALAPSRVGAARALALLLGTNGALVGLALSRHLGWAAPSATGAAVVGLFALSPPLLALAIVRTRTHGPLVPSDARAAYPALVATAAAGLTLALTGRVFPSAWADAGYLGGLNVVAAAAFAVAVRALGGLDASVRRWAAALVAVFGIHWASSQGAWVAGLLGAAGWAPALEALSIGTLLAFGLGATWGALRRLPAALPVPPPRPDPETERADARLAGRVRDVLQGGQGFLDPALTVETLATQLREPTRDVSRVLNARLGGGFHDVVGRLRVAEAQRLLLAEPDATVLEVLHRAGFSSTSAFHRVFRQHAGTTPGAFRRDPGAALLSPLGETTIRGDGAEPAIPVPGLGRGTA